MTKTRTCKGCNKSMDLIEFARTGVNDKSGNPYRRYYCKKYGCYWSHKKKTPNGRMENARKIMATEQVVWKALEEYFKKNK
jgi:hypothetical protein